MLVFTLKCICIAYYLYCICICIISVFVLYMICIISVFVLYLYLYSVWFVLYLFVLYLYLYCICICLSTTGCAGKVRWWWNAKDYDEAWRDSGSSNDCLWVIIEHIIIIVITIKQWGLSLSFIIYNFNHNGSCHPCFYHHHCHIMIAFRTSLVSQQRWSKLKN